MKILLNIIAFLFTISVISQTNNNEGLHNSNSDNAVLVVNDYSIYGESAVFFKPVIKKAEGSIYLFDKWDNSCVVFSVDNQKLSIKNINLNLERNVFETKIGKDSLFTFNFNNIKMFVVNGKKFKNYYFEVGTKVFQSLYEQESYEILKFFHLQLVKGSVNPMLNRPKDKYIQKSSYYIRENNLIKPLRLKKKSILRLVGNDSKKAKELIEYLKKQ
jgi:hypothetical protein